MKRFCINCGKKLPENDFRFLIVCSDECSNEWDRDMLKKNIKDAIELLNKNGYEVKLID